MFSAFNKIQWIALVSMVVISVFLTIKNDKIEEERIRLIEEALEFVYRECDIRISNIEQVLVEVEDDTLKQ